jgi:hypothetical protein
VNPGPAAVRGARGAVTLAVAGAVFFMAGIVIMTVAEISQAVTSRHADGLPGPVTAAVILAAGGLVLLALAAVVLIAPAGRRPGRRAAGRPGPSPHQPAPGSPGPRESIWAPAGRPQTARPGRARAPQGGWAQAAPAASASGQPAQPGPARAAQPGPPGPAEAGHRAGYADDGWYPDFLSGPMPAYRPAGPQPPAAGPQAAATGPPPAPGRPPAAPAGRPPPAARPHPAASRPVEPPEARAIPLDALPPQWRVSGKTAGQPAPPRPRLVQGQVVPAAETGDGTAAATR